MSVTPPDLLRGVLPVVISGGRPQLRDRQTRRLLAPLEGVTADPVWCVRDDRAAGYERDRWEVVPYPRAEAEDYAAAHWMGPGPYEPGAFLGCFTEREWACRIAEERGCWAVLQLDDNLRRLTAFVGYASSAKVVAARGGLAMFADLLAAVTLATNSRMTGAKLQAVNPATEPGTFVRPGFPYSLFVERVGPGREPYIGPVEEDILHAYQYAGSAEAATAALVYPLAYIKNHGGRGERSGMRVYYRAGVRAVGLQRMAPEMARLVVRQTHSNGRGEPRVFHWMEPGAIARRSPLAVRDRDLFEAARAYCEELAAEVMAEHLAQLRERLARRAARASGWRVAAHGA